MEDESSTILCLNDDCLFIIFNMLALKEQMILKLLCRRFEQVVFDCWHLKYKKWRRNTTENICELKWMVRNIRDFVEDLDLGILSNTELQLLAQYNFPNAHTLTAHAENVFGENLSILSKSFSNLKKLTLEGNLDLHIISSMTSLTELKIEFSGYEGKFYFKELFTKLKLRKFSFGYDTFCANIYDIEDLETIAQCTTLEEISLNAELLNAIIMKLPELGNLRMIACLCYELRNKYEETIFERLTSELGSRIITLISDNVVYPFPMGELKKLKNLQHWIMKDDFLSSYDCQSLRENLKNLRKLQIINTKLIKLQSNELDEYDDGYKNFEPLKIIGACKNLEILAVPLEWINEVFQLNDLIDIIRKQSYRKLPLELHCLRAENNSEIINTWQTDDYDKYLHISLVKYPEEEIDRYTVYYYSSRMFKMYINS